VVIYITWDTLNLGSRTMILAKHGTFLMFRMITRLDGGEHWIS